MTYVLVVGKLNNNELNELFNQLSVESDYVCGHVTTDNDDNDDGI